MSAQAIRHQSAELWTIEDIAAFLKLSPSTVRQKEVTKPDFPRRIRNLRSPRWIKGDVVKYYLIK